MYLTSYHSKGTQKEDSETARAAAKQMIKRLNEHLQRLQIEKTMNEHSVFPDEGEMKEEEVDTVSLGLKTFIGAVLYGR
jgi:pyruvoyl-dependent arginine decarboxylase (PvlArgDC)